MTWRTGTTSTASPDPDVTKANPNSLRRAAEGNAWDTYHPVEDIDLENLAESSFSVTGDAPRGEHGGHTGLAFRKEEDEDEPAPTRPTIINIVPRPSATDHHLSSVSDDAQSPPSTPQTEKVKEKQVSWSDLPNKRQLIILTLARLSEPLSQTSLQAYMFYQLRSFDPSLPDAAIAAQAGLLQGSFTVAQFITAMLWGRAADSEWGGRKKVLLIGLFGTGVSAIGFGFSRTFWQAVIFRTAGGALNGNVGTMRTMISEIVKEKK